MRKIPTSSISKKQLIILLLVLFLLAAVAIFLFLRKEESEMLGKSQLFSRVMQQGLVELKDRWELGDIEQKFSEGAFTCPRFIFNSKIVGPEYLQCNRNYLECYFLGQVGLKEKNLTIKIKDEKYHIRPVAWESGMFTKLDKDGAVVLELSVAEISNLSLTVTLKDTCSETLLPEGIYAAGTAKETEHMWDNVGQLIYVDKHYVSRQQVNEWIEVTGVAGVNLTENPELYPYPSVDLTPDQRQKYCAFRGKQLLASHVLDAASFIPDTKATAADKVFKYPYYWTRNKNESFLHHAAQLRKGELRAEECARAYVAGCESKGVVIHYPPDPVSWMGIKYPLGYYPESVVNYFEPEKNLKPSSFYFPASSPVHEVGYRGEWDGEGFKQSNLTIPDVDLMRTKIENFEIAFRCMKVVSQ